MRCSSIAETCASLATRESSFAWVRNSFETRKFSRISQRALLSTVRPRARIIWASDSISESMMMSLPTSATLFSTMPSYCCACAHAQESSTSIIVRILFMFIS